MLRLKIVKTKVEEERLLEPTDEGTLHGTQVLRSLVSPWQGSGRIVVADRYFASVEAANALYKMGLKFIGVVKTATRHFPMSYLQNAVLTGRGDRRAVVSTLGTGDLMMAVVWCDRERRYFIATTGSMEAGMPYVRLRWRQTDPDLQAPAEQMELTVEQPNVCQVYYESCGKIDQHNRHRHDTLKLEHKLRTLWWYSRIGKLFLE